MADPITIRGEGITLELLLHRIYGVRGRSLIATALDINPGLAGLGPFLPLGTRVNIPDLPVASAAPTRPLKTLFG